MYHIFKAAAAAAVLAAGGAGVASAATVAAFSADTSARLWLQSAYLAGTRVDAFHLLQFEYDSDYLWDGETSVGPVPVPGRYAFGLEGSSQGNASAAPQYTFTFGAAEQDVAIHTGDWCHDEICGPIDLTFGYELDVDVFTSVAGSVEGTATASAGARVYVRDALRTTVEADLEVLSVTGPGSFESLSRKRTGEISFTLSPFATIFAVTSIDIGGEIDVALPAPAPAPVPLPAALPLLGAGIAALAGLRRRKARA